MTSFLCWKNIYNSVIYFLNPNRVSSINHGDMEMVDLPAAPGQELYHRSHGLNHNAEFVSLTTGFITLCFFNMIVIINSLFTCWLLWAPSSWWQRCRWCNPQWGCLYPKTPSLVGDSQLETSFVNDAKWKNFYNFYNFIHWMQNFWTVTGSGLQSKI